MSYARWSEGDVYVFHHVYGYLVCLCCRLRAAHDDQDYRTELRSDLIAHLRAHVDRGDCVPPRAFERLEREIAEEGDRIPPPAEADILANELPKKS
jgi:hypothetical protein